MEETRSALRAHDAPEKYVIDANGGGRVHVTAVSTVDPSAFIEEGSVIEALVTVGPESRIHKYCHIFPKTKIGKKVVLEKGVTVGSNAQILDGSYVHYFARIEREASVGRDVEIRAGVTVPVGGHLDHGSFFPVYPVGA